MKNTPLLALAYPLEIRAMAAKVKEVNSIATIQDTMRNVSVLIVVLGSNLT